MSRWDWARNDAEGIDPSEITDSSKLRTWFHDDNCGRIGKLKSRMLAVVRIVVILRVLIGFNDSKSQRP